MHEDRLNIEHDVDSVRDNLREGKFQRSLCVLTAGASIASGLEIGYEHYRGSYGQRIMYTPVILSGCLATAGLWGFFSRFAARTILRWIAGITLADAVIGFVFHVRGIARKPAGWALPLTNVTMGPPLFAPLLFGTAAYLGLIASYLQREGDASDGESAQASPLTSAAQDIREGRFQQHMLAAAGLSALLSGAEAWYSHYKSGFRYKSQWWPIVLAPLLAIACAVGTRTPRVAKTVVPLLSAPALAVAGLGFYFHARGIVRRPGGIRYLPYNIIYGPPIFAPLLFGAAGGLGLLASQLRRSAS